MQGIVRQLYYIFKDELVFRYCVVFRVDKAMKACMLKKETMELHRGNGNLVNTD